MQLRLLITLKPMDPKDVTKYIYHIQNMFAKLQQINLLK
jgi:hypothetical protein